MQFDLFHSISRVDGAAHRLTDKQVFRQFFAEVAAAERQGFDTVWVAESHFSSEVQKRHKEPVIPHYEGEVGLNCDSLQLGQLVLERTQRIGFGTAILNIVGGNGGPIAAADRVRTFAWHNSLRPRPRAVHIGVAAGRFPYINAPFGIVPRSAFEADHWPQTQQLIFCEALTIFLRLINGDTLSSSDLSASYSDGAAYAPRWSFEALKLVPAMAVSDWQESMRIVLGSSSPAALEVAFKWASPDVFNLSFTPPAAIEELHHRLAEYCLNKGGELWHRRRLPRTVLVFIDRDGRVARERASRCLDTYIEAMRGTAQVPNKDVLMARALIGDSAQIRSQLQPGAEHSFHADDRLMLWFEFNQPDSAEVITQMQLFADEVMPYFTA